MPSALFSLIFQAHLLLPPPSPSSIGSILISYSNRLTPLVSSHRKLEMSVTENPKKIGAPPIVKLNKALKLAEVWVKNMSRSADDETPSVDTDGRPQRLGLGAKVSRQTKVGPSNDPVERKLHAKLDAEKRKAANIAKESTAVASDDDDEDNEDESRTNAFAKRKAPAPLSRPISGNKRRNSTRMTSPISKPTVSALNRRSIHVPFLAMSFLTIYSKVCGGGKGRTCQHTPSKTLRITLFIFGVGLILGFTNNTQGETSLIQSNRSFYSWQSIYQRDQDHMRN
ncbi:Phosphatidylinositol N-acetyglucosaminlytransferase subunit P protein [Trifolium repens]|nr:Phosphatidylinositol N-acetyglucosaminlytransferase subunit P protein [Trifolium repens]